MGRIDLSVPLFVFPTFPAFPGDDAKSGMSVKIGAEGGQGFRHVFLSVTKTEVAGLVIDRARQEQDT